MVGAQAVEARGLWGGGWIVGVGRGRGALGAGAECGVGAEVESSPRFRGRGRTRRTRRGHHHREMWRTWRVKYFLAEAQDLAMRGGQTRGWSQGRDV